MIGKLPCMRASSEVRVTFHDPQTGERVPAVDTKTGKPVWGGDWHPNLITDYGLDYLANIPSGGIGRSHQMTSNNYALVARLTLSGGMPDVKEPSGTIQATQSGTTVTADEPFFSSDDVGRVIVWADGSNARIATYVSATQVTVDKTQSVAAQTFERWRVDMATIPSPGESGTSGGSSEWAFTYDEDHLEWTISRWRQLELTANANINGFCLGEVAGTAVIAENIRDASGNPITVSLLAGKAVRVDHRLVMRLPRANQQIELRIDEYDAANQLIDTAYYEADMWPVVQGMRSVSSEYLLNLLNPAHMNLNTTSTSYGSTFLGSRTQTPGDTSDVVASGDRTRGALGSSEISQYVNGSRTRARIAQSTAEYGNGPVYGIYLASGSSTSGANPEAGFIIQWAEGEAPLNKENTHTLSLGYQVSWDRDYTVS